ncbi:MAG: hypothetical protein OEY94_06745 [Alphaproteobacteria bacterium]|nr:hypothetical protein [Alphaproteobacteria bacterium]
MDAYTIHLDHHRRGFLQDRLSSGLYTDINDVFDKALNALHEKERQIFLTRGLLHQSIHIGLGQYEEKSFSYKNIKTISKKSNLHIINAQRPSLYRLTPYAASQIEELFQIQIMQLDTKKAHDALQKLESHIIGLSKFKEYSRVSKIFPESNEIKESDLYYSKTSHYYLVFKNTDKTIDVITVFPTSAPLEILLKPADTRRNYHV